MNNSKFISYQSFLFAKFRNEVREQIKANNIFIAETREFIDRCQVSSLELKYVSACTFDYLYGLTSTSFLPENDLVKLPPVRLIVDNVFKS